MWDDKLNRFELVALATDLTIEGDAARLMPQGSRLHVTRIAFENPTAGICARPARGWPMPRRCWCRAWR